MLLALLAPTACGGSSGADAPKDYPLVEQTAPAPVTTYEANAGTTCERTLATYHDGSMPTRRPVVIPAPPGLRAVAVTEHTTRVDE